MNDVDVSPVRTPCSSTSRGVAVRRRTTACALLAVAACGGSDNGSPVQRAVAWWRAR